MGVFNHFLLIRAPFDPGKSVLVDTILMGSIPRVLPNLTSMEPALKRPKTSNHPRFIPSS